MRVVRAIVSQHAVSSGTLIALATDDLGRRPAAGRLPGVDAMVTATLPALKPAIADDHVVEALYLAE